jgi:hypothetical protein
MSAALEPPYGLTTVPHRAAAAASSRLLYSLSKRVAVAFWRKRDKLHGLDSPPSALAHQ